METLVIKTKICPVCKIDKPFSEYHKRSARSSGIQPKCIACASELKKKKYWSNRDVELAKLTKSRLKPENVQQRKGYYEKNKEAYKERNDKYMQDEELKKRKSERGKQRYLKNKEAIQARHKRNYERAKAEGRLSEIHRQKKATDPVYNIKRRLRFRLRHIVKALGNNSYKRMSSLELLGCDMPAFKAYIESKFTEGMSWERLSEIHIDHIRPCASFDLSDMEEQKKCFHYTNLQPLWDVDNLKKGSRYNF